MEKQPTTKQQSTTTAEITAVAEAPKQFKLPNYKVTVTPVRRKGGWLSTNHEASFLFKHSSFTFTLPMKPMGGFVDPLTQEEKDFLESTQAGLDLKKDDLNINKRENNYWKTYRVKLDKNLRVLDLSKPADYIAYKVLLANKDLIAPSAQDKYKKGTYKYALEREGAQDEEKFKEAGNKMKAYSFFASIENSPTKMRNFINVYNLKKRNGRVAAANSTKEFLVSEIQKIVDADMLGFIEQSVDPNYENHIIIFNGILCGAIKREGITYKTMENKILGDTLEQLTNFYGNPVNSEELVKLQSRIENSSMVNK
jgi:hypothetical protein